MRELVIGDPGRAPAADVGPVIDEEAQAMLQQHVERLSGEGDILYRCPLPDSASKGTFVAPVAVEVSADP
ncbi:MAG: aldehyde dehydrogenase family protein [Woeseiaceae bacterium]|nr:aldehyde dehydrogenase family protein [Woeseiaceae bacterium]